MIDYSTDYYMHLEACMQSCLFMAISNVKHLYIPVMGQTFAQILEAFIKALVKMHKHKYFNALAAQFQA